MEILFELKNIKYKTILDINHLIIPKNKITCIVGQSGSGKTTFLKLLNNLISSDEGQIFYKGQNIEDIDPVELRRKVVMLGQNPITFPGNIKENLDIALKFAEKEDFSNEELNKYLHMVNLEKHLEESVEKLSGGEKQRLALARIIMLDSPVLLLDEPSSSLDENTEEFVINMLVDHAKKNKKTLIMVTHSKKIANQFGENIIEIKKSLV